MVWVGADVAVDNLSTENTAVLFESYATKYFPRASKRVGHQEKKNVTFLPHTTLLYHGHQQSDAFIRVFEAFGLANLQIGTDGGSSRIVGPKRVCNADRNIYCIVLSIDCAAMQELYAKFRKAVEQATGETSKQGPHLGPNGEHAHLNDFDPHITMAYYNDQETLDADWNELVKKRDTDISVGESDAMAIWRGKSLRLCHFQMH